MQKLSRQADEFTRENKKPSLEDDTWTREEPGLEEPQTLPLFASLKLKTKPGTEQLSECHSQTGQEAIGGWRKRGSNTVLHPLLTLDLL